VSFLKISTLLLLTININATTLPQLINSGLAHNSVIKKTELQIKLMRAKQEESRAKRFGKLDAVGSYTHYNLPRTLAPIVPSSLSPTSSVNTTQDLFSSGVQYSVALFTGGMLEQQINIDKVAQKMAESHQKLSREELIYNIRSLYLSALSLQELQLSQESYVEAIRDIRDIISIGLDIGKKAKIELLKADNDLQSAKGKVAITKSKLRMTKMNLETLTHFKSINILEPVEVEISEIESLKSDNIEQLERFRLQDLEIERGDRNIQKVASLKMPQVGLNAYVGHNYDFDQIDPFEKEQLWQVAVNVKWNIFDFGANDAKIQQAKIAKLQAIVAKETTTEGFRQLFAKAQEKIETSLANYHTNLSQFRLLQETEKIEEARYDAGVATLNDLLLAKSKTELAKSQMIQSKYTYQNGIFYLDYLFERGVSN